MINRRNIVIGGGALGLAGATGAYSIWRQMGSLTEYEDAVAARRTALTQHPEMTDFIRYATLAPSGHNTQPWQFRIGESRIDILPDVTRRTEVVDPDDHHLFVSLGCAVENMSLAAAAVGMAGKTYFDSKNGGSIGFEFGQSPAVRSPLFDAIPKRQSTRSLYDGKAVSLADLRVLADAAVTPGVDMVTVTDRSHIDRIRDLVVAGNSVQMADKAFVKELKHWLRFSPRYALQTGDGLFSAASGSPVLPEWLGQNAFEWAFKASSENDKYARQIASSAGIAVFIAQKANPEHWILAGRACQRFALQATALGLKCTFVNQPVEVAALRPELASDVGLSGRRPDLVMRFGYGKALPYSARRLVASATI